MDRKSISKLSLLAAVVIVGSAYPATCFILQKSTFPERRRLVLSGNGDNDHAYSSQGAATSKTYSDAARTPLKDLIDTEAAMADFFLAREDWLPLFRTVALAPRVKAPVEDGNEEEETTILPTQGLSCPAAEYLPSTGDLVSFDDDSSPWKRREAIPTHDLDREVLAGFLDSMHQALVDIPVTESKVEDENDLHFLEEGRRMLAINRFHVLRENQSGSLEQYDDLFATCWSELMELTSSAQEHTGSLILLPDYNESDLRRFADMNLQRPLEWLGVDMHFEVAAMHRGSPALRLLYKLRDMPETIEVTTLSGKDPREDIPDEEL